MNSLNTCMIVPLGLLFFAACDDAVPDAGALDGGGLDLGIIDVSAPQKDAGPVDLGEGVDLGEAQDAGEVDIGLSDGRFETLAPMPRGPRQETAVVALFGEIYLIGGFDESAQFLPEVEAYDPSTDTWRDIAALPAPLHHANAAAVLGKIYVLGYLVGGFGQEGRAFEYDPAMDAWSEIAPSPMPAARARGASAIAVDNEKIYIIGGFRNGVAVSQVDVFDPLDGSFSPLPPLPRPSDHVVAGGHNGKLYVAGGRQGGLTSHTAQLDIFDITTNVWSTGPDMPTSRAGAMAAMLDGRLYVFGGEGNSGNPPTLLFDQVEVFDIAENFWRALMPMDPPRHGTGAASLDGRIYVPGGADVQAFGATDLNEAFVP